LDDGGVAIFAASSTRPSHDSTFSFCAFLLFAERLFRRRGRNFEMRQLRSLLRAAPSRIGRRLSQIVAIAAASLAAAGV
jgi:hypothetical protein